jgi:hypothetical protein
VPSGLAFALVVRGTPTVVRDAQYVSRIGYRLGFVKGGVATVRHRGNRPAGTGCEPR